MLSNSKFACIGIDSSHCQPVYFLMRNVLTRRREYGTYLATARRHRRRIKMQKRDELRNFQPALRPSSAVESSSTADEGRSAG